MIVIEEKIEWLKNQFSSLKTAEEKYQYLILLGSQLPPFPKEEEIEAKKKENIKELVQGRIKEDSKKLSEKKREEIFEYIFLKHGSQTKSGMTFCLLI